MKPRTVFCDKVERNQSMVRGQEGWCFVFTKLDEGTTVVLVDKNPEAFHVGRLYKVTIEELKPEDRVST